MPTEILHVDSTPASFTVGNYPLATLLSGPAYHFTLAMDLASTDAGYGGGSFQGVLTPDGPGGLWLFDRKLQLYSAVTDLLVAEVGPLTWPAGAAIQGTVTIDSGVSSLTVEGADSGDGQVTFVTEDCFSSTTLGVGQFSDHLTFLLLGSVSSLDDAVPDPPPGPPAPPPPVLVDHAEAALARLPQQFLGKPKIELLVRALSEPIQRFEEVAFDVLTKRWVDTAEGAQLEVVGRKVGQPRTDASQDDDIYRRFIRARIATNRSSGTLRDLIKVTRLVIDSPGTTVTIRDRPPATVEVALRGLATSLELANVLLLFLKVAKSTSVRLVITFFNHEPLFRLDVGPGFGQGHLLSSVE